jgi:hypothetical protein
MLDASAHFDSRGPCFPQLAQHPHGGLYGGGGELHGSAALYAPSGESVARPAGTSAPQTIHNFGAAAATAAGVGAKPMYSVAAAQQAVYGAPHGLVPPHPQLAGTNWMPIPAVWQFPGLAPGVMDPRVGGGFEHSAAAAAMMYPAMLLHAPAMVTAAAAEAATRRESERKRLQRERAMLGAPGGAKSRFTGVSWHKPTQRWQVKIHFAGKQKALGRFDSEVAAARAWDAFAVAHGMQRRLNFPCAAESEGAAPPAAVKRRSRFTGVSWYKAGSKWEAYIRFQGKQKSLGYYFDEHEAARAYDTFAIENSVNRPLNFPDAPTATRHAYEPSKKRARAKATAAAAAAAAEEKSNASSSSAPAAAAQAAAATTPGQRQYHGTVHAQALAQWRAAGGNHHMYPERAARAHRAYVREAGIDLPLNFETAAAGAQSAKRRKTAAACRTLAAAAAIAAETERVAAEAGS